MLVLAVRWYLQRRIWGEEKVRLQPDDVSLLFLGYDVIITNYVISTYVGNQNSLFVWDI